MTCCSCTRALFCHPNASPEVRLARKNVVVGALVTAVALTVFAGLIALFNAMTFTIGGALIFVAIVLSGKAMLIGGVLTINVIADFVKRQREAGLL